MLLHCEHYLCLFWECVFIFGFIHERHSHFILVKGKFRIASLLYYGEVWRDLIKILISDALLTFVWLKTKKIRHCVRCMTCIYIYISTCHRETDRIVFHLVKKKSQRVRVPGRFCLRSKSPEAMCWGYSQTCECQRSKAMTQALRLPLMRNQTVRVGGFVWL